MPASTMFGTFAGRMPAAGIQVPQAIASSRPLRPFDPGA